VVRLTVAFVPDRRSALRLSKLETFQLWFSSFQWVKPERILKVRLKLALTLTLSPEERERTLDAFGISGVGLANSAAGGCVGRRMILPRLGEKSAGAIP